MYMYNINAYGESKKLDDEKPDPNPVKPNPPNPPAPLLRLDLPSETKR